MLQATIREAPSAERRIKPNLPSNKKETVSVRACVRACACERVRACLRFVLQVCVNAARVPDEEISLQLHHPLCGIFLYLLLHLLWGFLCVCVCGLLPEYDTQLLLQCALRLHFVSCFDQDASLSIWGVFVGSTATCVTEDGAPYKSTLSRQRHPALTRHTVEQTQKCQTTTTTTKKGRSS